MSVTRTVGRPKQVNSKSGVLQIRIDGDFKRMLDEYVAEYGVSRAEALRGGMRILFSDSKVQTVNRDYSQVFDIVCSAYRGTDEWQDVNGKMFANFGQEWIEYKESKGYNLLGRGYFASSKDWLSYAVKGTGMVLRGESSLVYQGVCTPMRTNPTVDVYSDNIGSFDNVIYADMPDGLEVIDDGGVKYATFSYTVNEMMLPYSMAVGGTLLEALVNYYVAHNDSFDGLNIWDENREKFDRYISKQVERERKEQW